jgi:predicted nucleic acid-binding protein
MPRPTELLIAEPPSEYRVRPPLVVDASVLAACVFGEPERDAAEARLRGFALHAPALIDYELANVATTKLRRKDLAPELAAQALAEFAAMALERHAPAPQGMAALAWRYGLSAYDAAYLWLAGELKAPLATFDRRLAEAATTHLGTLSTA